MDIQPKIYGLPQFLSYRSLDSTVYIAKNHQVWQEDIVLEPYAHVSAATLALRSNSLWASDTIWWQRCGSTLAQEMACCLRHQAITWTNIGWSSVKSNDIHIRAFSQQIPQPSLKSIWKLISKLSLKFPRGHWVNKVSNHRWLTYWIVFKIIKNVFPLRTISRILLNRRRPNSQWSNPTCCISYSVNNMPAYALAT